MEHSHGRAERVFMGWDSPALLASARYLRDRYADQESRTWDLSNVVVVTPAARAGRRFLEILIEEAGRLVLRPPRQVITLGSLPELLYPTDTPIASEFVSLIARAAAIRQIDPERLSLLFPHPPSPGDTLGWLALARDLERLSADLASELLEPADVPQKCPMLTDSERWDVIAQIHRDHAGLLLERGLVDQHRARFDAVHNNLCTFEGDLILLSVTDLTGVAHAMLKQIASSSTNATVTSLIHAPSSVSEGFDELGKIRAGWWENRPVSLQSDQIHFVDRPADQARQALAQIVELARDPSIPANQSPAVDPQEVTIGLGDETMASLLEQTLELAGLPARPAVGREISKTAPVMLLSAFSRFLERHRLDEFSAVLRHPDLERYVRSTLATDMSTQDDSLFNSQSSQLPEDWITVLDQYITRHIQLSVEKGWIEPQDGSIILTPQAAFDAVLALTPDDRGVAKPLGLWSPTIAALLERVYSSRELSRDDEQDAALIASLTLITDALREQAALDPLDLITPKVTLAEALSITVSRIEGNVPALVRGPAVELLGWLELQLDDAPILVVTGFNEGNVPQSINADAFLPNSARKDLGLVDNHRRYARDLYALTAILYSRSTVRLIAGRRGLDDEPLAPSRLLLACNQKTEPGLLARRILDFYETKSAQTQTLYAATRQPAPAIHSGFVMPVPMPGTRRFERLSVTAFKEYMACPYRFYLKYVRKLRSIDDGTVEMDGAAFGNLAHAVLKEFGQGPLTSSENQDQIAASLASILKDQAVKAYGSNPNAAVAIQIMQLDSRLAAFARSQADLARNGWRIQRDLVEKQFAVPMDVNGSTLTIDGQIDRIDLHPEMGYRILDYKTADTAHTPESTHQKKSSAGASWIDLQLPLYDFLARGAGIHGLIKVGYFNLPKKSEETLPKIADWESSDIASAIQTAGSVIADIRAEKFWPPAEPPAYDDDVSGICMDGIFGRADAIQQANKSSPLSKETR